VSQFVAVCRREWKRLGVPEIAANEMAADLEADLAEAQADGVSPEEVLGNGYFDARSFAASWALARGVAQPDARPISVTQLPARTLILSAGVLVSLAVAAMGLILVAGHASSSVALSVRRSIQRPVPAIFVGPHRFLSGPDLGVHLVGGLLVAVGLAGLGLSLWIWKPWAHPALPASDTHIGLPSYL
jgi:hypothetical protein